MTILLILTKLFVSSGILFGYYRLFLRNRKFHRYNRFYLLVSVLVSLLLPFLKIEILLSPTAPGNQLLLNTLNSITVYEGESETIAPVASTHWMEWFTSTNILWTLYIIGAIVFLSLLIRSLIYIRKIQAHYQAEKIDDLKFYNTSEPGTPFSFFRNIFWNSKVDFNSNEGQQIFRHELFHVRQQHSADLLFMEIVLLLAWFNPFFYLIKKELKAIHEFLADEYAVSNTDEYAYAELLVLFALHEKQNKLVHPFFHNTIKRRIAMITNLKNKKVGYLGRVMALPLSFLLFSFIVIKAQKTETPGDNVSENTNPIIAKKPITVVIDAGHGGASTGAVSNDNTVFEKDINLDIANKIAGIAQFYNLNIILIRSNDYTVNVKERMEFINSTPYDLLVSIHVNATSAGREPRTDYPNKSGFELFVSGNNKSTTKQSELLATHLITKLESLYTTSETIKIREAGDVYMLDKGNKPAVMLQCGYITNNKDLTYIKDPNNQFQIASKILEGIAEYSNSQEVNISKHENNENNEETYKKEATDTVPKKVLESGVVTIKRPEKKSPSQKEWDSWKDEKTYGVWLDGKRIKNEVLGNHTPNEYSWYNVSKLAKNTVNYGKHYYQVNLFSHDYFKKEFPEKTKTINVQKMSYVSDTVKLEKSELQQKLKELEASKKLAKIDKKDGILYLKFENDANVYSTDMETFESVSKAQTVPSVANEEIVFKRVQVESEFIGGQVAWAKFLNENINYPRKAIAKEIEGTVIVQFIVNKDGTVSDVTLINGNAILGEEAIRVIKLSSGKWSSAVQNGRNVKAYKKQPIVFSFGRK